MVQEIDPSSAPRPCGVLRAVSSSGSRNQPGRCRIVEVAIVASSAASMASKGGLCAPRSGRRAGCASTSRASRDGPGMSPKNRWRSPCSNHAALARGRAPPHRDAAPHGAGLRPRLPAGAGCIACTGTCRVTRRRRRRGPARSLPCRPARLRSHTTSQRSCTIAYPFPCLRLSPHSSSALP